MFVYEKGNTLNVTFKGNVPVENPEVVIKGFKDGATVTINGTTYGSGSEEFEEKAKTLVYQKDSKLMITFNGVEGMSAPEVTLDETSKGTVEISVGSESFVINYTEDEIIVGENTSSDETQEPEEEPEEVVIPEVSGESAELEEEVPEE